MSQTALQADSSICVDDIARSSGIKSAGVDFIPGTPEMISSVEDLTPGLPEMK